MSIYFIFCRFIPSPPTLVLHSPQKSLVMITRLKSHYRAPTLIPQHIFLIDTENQLSFSSPHSEKPRWPPHAAVAPSNRILPQTSALHQFSWSIKSLPAQLFLAMLQSVMWAAMQKRSFVWQSPFCAKSTPFRSQNRATFSRSSVALRSTLVLHNPYMAFAGFFTVIVLLTAHIQQIIAYLILLQKLK